MKRYLKVFALVHRLSPSTLIYGFLKTLTGLTGPYLNLFFTAIVLNEFVGLSRKDVLMQYIAIFLITQGILALMQAFFTMKSEVSNDNLTYILQDALTLKSIDMSYSQLADPETRLLFQKAEEGSNFNGGIHTFVTYVVDEIFKMIIAIAVAGGAIVQLVLVKAPQSGALAQFANSWVYGGFVAILLVLPIILSLVMSKKGAMIQFKMFEDATTINRELGYYASTLFSDADSGKTIRMYDASSMLMKVFYKCSNYFTRELRKTLIRVEGLNAFGKGVTIACVGCLYLLVGIKSQLGMIALGSVLMYVGYIQTLVNTMVSGASQLAQGTTIVEYLGFYDDYLNLPKAESGDVHFSRSDELTIEFKDVSFSYPGSDTLILENINLTINPNQRMALVGKNGAGKTSFIKLLTRLYQPTQGTILCNGVDINTLDLKSYYDLLAVVFQDFTLYPFAIDENIALSTSINDNRIQESLNLVGIADTINALSNGVKTNLKGQMDEGIRLSGGQSQKLAIARAWYKDAPLVILDEPTAALDPISESEIYSHFNEIMGKKSAIFVSHRMSSCQFCDRIVVFDEGTVKEDGSHQNLMAITDGLYRSLFEAQAQYYQ